MSRLRIRGHLLPRLLLASVLSCFAPRSFHPYLDCFFYLFFPTVHISFCTSDRPTFLSFVLPPAFAFYLLLSFNSLMPNDHYRGRTAQLTSKVSFYKFIQQIWVLNILNMVYTLRFFPSKCSLFHNYNVFGSCIIHILYAECAKIKKK